MKIILYTKTGCPWCAEVLDLLRAKNVTFEERNVTDNGDFFTELLARSGQTKTPTMDIDGEIFADTDVDAVKKVLIEKKHRGF